MQKWTLAVAFLGITATLTACGRSEPLALGALEDATADASTADASTADASTTDASPPDATPIGPPVNASVPKFGLRWQPDGLTLNVASADATLWLFGLTRADSGAAISLSEACIPDGDTPALCHPVPPGGTLTLRSVEPPRAARLGQTTTWSQADEAALTYVLLPEDSAFGGCFTFGAATALYTNALGCLPLPLAP